jgi:hypothetical protein
MPGARVTPLVCARFGEAAGAVPRGRMTLCAGHDSWRAGRPAIREQRASPAGATLTSGVGRVLDEGQVAASGTRQNPRGISHRGWWHWRCISGCSDSGTRGQGRVSSGKQRIHRCDPGMGVRCRRHGRTTRPSPGRSPQARLHGAHAASIAVQPISTGLADLLLDIRPNDVEHTGVDGQMLVEQPRRLAGPRGS